MTKKSSKTKLNRDNPTIGLLKNGKIWHIERKRMLSYCGLKMNGLRALFSARPDKMDEPFCTKCMRGFRND